MRKSSAIGLVLSDNFPIGIPRNEFWAAHIAVRKSCARGFFKKASNAAFSAPLTGAMARSEVSESKASRSPGLTTPEGKTTCALDPCICIPGICNIHTSSEGGAYAYRVPMLIRIDLRPVALPVPIPSPLRSPRLPAYSGAASPH